MEKLKIPKTWTVKVITLEEFRSLVIKYLLHEWKHRTKEELVDIIVEEGFMRFNKDTLGDFMKSLQGKVFMAPIAVDINDSMFYWLVSGSDAILINKTIFEPKFDNL